MKDISSALLTAQQASTRTPYVMLWFQSKDRTEAEFYSDRFMGLEYHLELYGGRATILLNNNDHLVRDLKGFCIELVLGYNTSVGDEWVFYPILWVKSRMNVSFPGTQMVALELEGVWENLTEKPCLISTEPPLSTDVPAPYHTVTYSSENILYDILQYILFHAGVILPATLEMDDGVMGSFAPEFTINETVLIKKWDSTTGTEYLVSEPRYETYKDVVIRIMNLTYSYLRAVPGYVYPKLEVVYPALGEGDLQPNETYYSYKSPYFYEFVHRENVAIPNHVLIYCNQDPETGLFLDPI
ncbi:MAG: hypothetical protein KAJ19_27810, partial [Gammaproteobacteria bacterium]|nr:hypothetical protein [Gammaproteobacteria bacterium]